MRRSPAERLIGKRRREDRGYATDCLVFTGSLSNGYGQIGIGGKYGRPLGVHVVAWEAVHGRIPPGLQLHHRCEQRDCHDVSHLELVTPAQHLDRHRPPPIDRCRRAGHPYTEENTHRSGGKRWCKSCRRNARAAAR